MFTLFYVGAELWGDVVLSLLFWGLANEMTSLQEAPLLYPLFGVGANIGQTVSGKALSTFAAFAEHRLAYATQLQVSPLLTLSSRLENAQTDFKVLPSAQQDLGTLLSFLGGDPAAGWPHIA